MRIETIREANDAVLAAMKRYPGRSGRYCSVQPGNGAAALDEIERYLEAGMIGVKLYNQFKLDDPAVFRWRRSAFSDGCGYSLGRTHGGGTRGWLLAQPARVAGAESRMIVDSHAYLGHDPLRALRDTTAAAMIGRMDRMASGRSWCCVGRRWSTGMRTAATRLGLRRR